MNKNILSMALVAGSIAFSAGAQASILIDNFSDNTPATDSPNIVNTALSPTSSDFSTNRNINMDPSTGAVVPGGGSFLVFAGELGLSADLATQVDTAVSYTGAGMDFTTPEGGGSPFFDTFVLALTSIDQGGVLVSLTVNGVTSASQLVQAVAPVFFDHSEFGNLTNVTDVRLNFHNNTAVDASFDSLGSFGGRPQVPVPEPTAIALLGMGLAAFGFGRRKAK